MSDSKHDDGRSVATRYDSPPYREDRARRGRRIVALLQAHVGERRFAFALDVGCSAGLITREIAPTVEWMVGLDSDAEAIAHANAHHAAGGRLAFVRGSGCALPFAASTFDLVVCNHVYEHVDDARALMAEIARVLRPGGVCWFAAGHTWQLVEPHYRLPLLSMLPRRLASAVVRATGRDASYTIRFLPPWRVRSLFASFAEARLVSVDALRDPLRYDLAEGPLRFAAGRWMARKLAPALAWIAPTQLWVLRK